MLNAKYEIYRNDQKEAILFDLVIGIPQALPKEGFEVEIKLEGLFATLPKLKGDTAFEALLNSLLFVSNLMAGYQKEGHLIKVIQNNEQWEVDFPMIIASSRKM